MLLPQARIKDVIPLEHPILLNGRYVTEIEVMAGQTVHIPVRDGINTSPKIWGPDAKTFQPERWLQPKLDDEAVKIKTPNHILTFGEG